VSARRSFALLTALVTCAAIPATNCKSSKPQKRDQTKREPPASVVLTIAAPSLEAALGQTEALIAKAKLPVAKERLAPMLLNALEVPPYFAEKLDLSRPFAFVLTNPPANALATKGEESGDSGQKATKSPGHNFAATFSLRPNVDPRVVLEELGAKTSQTTQGAEPIQAKIGDEGFFAQVVERTITVSDTKEGLLDAGPAAAEAAASAQAAAAKAKSGTGSHALTIRGFVKEVKKADWFADLVAGDVSGDLAYYADELEEFVAYLDIHPEDGLRLGADLEAVPGSALETQLQASAALKPDPHVLAGPPPIILVVQDSKEALLDSVQQMRRKAAASPLYGELAGHLEEQAELLEGAATFRADAIGQRLSLSGSSYSASKPKPQALLDFTDRVFKSGVVQKLIAQLEADSGEKVPVEISWKRAAATAGQLTLATSDEELQKGLGLIFGSKDMVFRMEATKGRTLFATEPEAKAAIAKLDGRPPKALHPAVDRTLQAMAKREGFASIELLGLTRFILKVAGQQSPEAAQFAAMMQFLPGLSEIDVPLYVSGKGKNFELYLPAYSFESVGRVAGPLQGLMGR